MCASPIKTKFLQLATAAAALVVQSSFAQFYSAGDVVQEFSLSRRGGGEPIRLSDFEGKIVFIEWFAWWCPFCQAAAPQVRDGITRYYAELGGNPDGIPVVHLAVNLQPNQEAQTQNFIVKAGLDLVGEDFNRALANRFQSGGQPIFAIINGVTNSPSHKPWELILHQNGYGQTQSPITKFQIAINAVKAAPRPVPPRFIKQPQPLFVIQGQAAVFQADYAPDSSMIAQWTRDGVDLPGATSTTLRISSVVPADAGEYRIRLSNAAGVIVSEPARLSVAMFAMKSPELFLSLADPASSLQFRIRGESNAAYRLQRSVDLLHWSEVQQVIPTTADQLLTVMLPQEAAGVFFRLVSP